MDFKTYFMAMSVPERDEFAARCGTSRAHLTNIAYGNKPCGESLCINIERESDGIVRCESLRPDVDWAYLRGTDCPEPSDGKPRSAGEDRRKIQPGRRSTNGHGQP